MNKSQLIAHIKSCTTSQAQGWYDHIFTYIQANKQYPRLRYIGDKIGRAMAIDADLAATVATMTKLGYKRLSDYRTIARYLTQYHKLIIPSIIRIPQKADGIKVGDASSVVIHNITAGFDVTQGDTRYSRNLDSDLTKLLG